MVSGDNVPWADSTVAVIPSMTAAWLRCSWVSTATNESSTSMGAAPSGAASGGGGSGAAVQTSLMRPTISAGLVPLVR